MKEIEQRIKIARDAIANIRRSKLKSRHEDSVPNVDSAWGCMGVLDYVQTGNPDMILASGLRKEVKKLIVE